MSVLQEGIDSGEIRKQERTASRTKELGLGGAVVFLTVLFFFLLYWNRFAGLRSGSASFGAGMGLMRGEIPYRDYFAAATPLNTIKSAIVLKLFGAQVITLRTFDIVQRAGMGVIAFAWLSRVFALRASAIAAVVATIVSAGDVSDPISSYNHDTILLGIVSALIASFALDAARSPRTLALIGFGSGVFAALCLLSKQTIGLGITVCVPVVVAFCLLRIEGARKAAAFLPGFLVGWLLIASVFVAWLFDIGALQSFADDVFRIGPAAKASHPVDFLERFIYVCRNYYFAATLIALVGTVAVIKRLVHGSRAQSDVEHSNHHLAFIMVAILAAGIGCSVLATVVSWFIGPLSFLVRLSNQSLKSAVCGTFFCVILAGLCWATPLFRGGITRKQAHCLLLAGVSFSTAFMLWLSWPVFEAMAVPGLGLVIAALLSYGKSRYNPLVHAVCAGLVFATTLVKLERPIGFADFVEPPVRLATIHSVQPALTGLLLPPQTANLIDGVVSIVQAHSKPGERIFVYPEMSLFYILTQRSYPTLTGSHNIDVVNDAFARDEAARLLLKPPAVLIYLRDPNYVREEEEILWRHGQPSGNRAIVAAVESLAGRYRLAGIFGSISVYTRD